MSETSFKLIHVASMIQRDQGLCYLFLRKKEDYHYCWYMKSNESELENETVVFASTIEEALRLARRTWKEDYFRTLNCGFRYTLPERDEHGMNALYYQMTASYNSMNGVYFDDELGHNCFVQNASIEARNLMVALSPPPAQTSKKVPEKT